MAAGFLESLSERVVVFDGATGTNLQARTLGADDFGGLSLEGCYEVLAVTRPDVIAALHDSSRRRVRRQKYRGSCYSWGYPACPDLEDQVRVGELLDAARIGVSVSEEYQLHPEQSTSAIVVHHPEAKYFIA